MCVCKSALQWNIPSDVWAELKLLVVCVPGQDRARTYDSFDLLSVLLCGCLCVTRLKCCFYQCSAA